MAFLAPDNVLAFKATHGRPYQEVPEAWALAQADGFPGVAHDQRQTVEPGQGRVAVRHITLPSEKMQAASGKDTSHST
ncbi:MAG: hypothetical protein HY689_04070 [Chloroflexi bacterium]|nr:hypothetical protein [Chloroflexota bacterium]